MKKQTKRIISLILSCLMILSGMTLPAFADDAATASTATEPHILDFENLATSDGLSASQMRSYVGSSEIVSLAADYSSYSIASMTGADGNETKALKFISDDSSEVLVSKRSFFRMYGSNATNNSTGTWTVDFDFYNNYYNSQYMQLKLSGANYTFATNYDNVISAGSIADTSEKVNTGWHHVNAVINLDKKEMSVKLDNTELGTRSIAYGNEAYIYSFIIGFSTAKNSWWAIDNFTTSWKAFSYEDNCKITVENENELKIGRVMTVNATAYPDFTSAKIYFDDEEISTLTENGGNSYAVRYLIPESIAKGTHTVKLVASYAALSEAVEKTQSVTVYGKNEAPDAYIKDFEEYTALSDAGTAMDSSSVKLNIDLWDAHGNPKYYIYKDSITNSLALKFNNETDSDLGVGSSFAYFYAGPQNDGSKKNYTSGRVSLEFDFYLEKYYSTYMVLTPYAASGYTFTQGGTGNNIIQVGEIAGTNTTVDTGWHHLKAMFDLDKMKVDVTIDDTAMAQRDLTFPTGQNNLYMYRIGISTPKNDSSNYWSIDNIKTGYLESEILASTAYVKGADSFNADKVVAFDADSIKLNVRKEYGTLSANDVTVEINGAAPAAVTASYADGAITVPLADLTIAEGDTIKVTVSYDAYLADGTYVDEPVIAEFVAGNSDGGAIIVENGMAKAYFGIKANAAASATVYLAAYKDDTLEALTSSAINLTGGAASYESAILTLPQYDEIKCFVWTDVTPLIKVIEK